MDKGADVQAIILGPYDLVCAHADEQALVEQEVARMSGDGLRLATGILGRIVEIEAQLGPDVAEAVIERIIETLRGGRRVLS